jgi:hypothetical protein
LWKLVARPQIRHAGDEDPGVLARLQFRHAETKIRVVDGLFNTPRKDEVSDNDSLRNVVVSEGRLYLDGPHPVGRSRG